MFQRRDATGRQPQFTGVGVLSRETLETILGDDGEFQVAVWTMWNGKPMRNRDGGRRFRLHIEPAWHDEDDSGMGDDPDEFDDEPDDDPAEDDDIPF